MQLEKIKVKRVLLVGSMFIINTTTVYMHTSLLQQLGLPSFSLFKLQWKNKSKQLWIELPKRIIMILTEEEEVKKKQKKKKSKKKENRIIVKRQRYRLFGYSHTQ